jgi:PBP1b-binding outer membrane lipoprotein LpoB
LREMAANLAPKVLECDDVRKSGGPVSVVVKNMTNKTRDIGGQDMDIYVAKLAGLLNTNVTKDRLTFVEERATLQNMQAQELGSPDPYGQAGRVPAADGRVLPQYALYGTVYSLDGCATTYYYFEFKLTNLVTGVEAWHGDYDVRTLNY